MAINFPNSPTNGDTHTVNGITFTYNSAKTAWAPSSAIEADVDTHLNQSTATSNQVLSWSIYQALRS